MRAYTGILRMTGLFEGIDEAEIEAILTCIGAEIRRYKKGDILLLAGDKPQNIGIVLTGQLHVVREDYNGNSTLLAATAPGEFFAEALCCAGVTESPVTVMAYTDCSVLLLAFTRIVRTCSSACSFHTKLVENMLGLIANNSLLLQNQMEILSKKSVRAKVMRYLETLVPVQGREINVPFNREKMAHYLCIERSALSHELSKMRKDGLIEYRKNRFVLK